MKKLLSSVSVILVLVMLLSMAACNGEGSNVVKSNFVVPENGYDGSEVTITFYHTMGSNLTTVLDQYIAEFNTIYPNIHIEYTSVGGYDDVRDQIKTEISATEGPNIAYCYPDHIALYNKARGVIALDELIDDKEYGFSDEEIEWLNRIKGMS